MSRERASTMQSSGGATNCRLMAPAVRRRLAGHGLVRLDVEQVGAAAVGDDLDTRVREQHPDSDGNLPGRRADHGANATRADPRVSERTVPEPSPRHTIAGNLSTH